MDTRLSDLIAAFSRDEAKRAWEAGRAAMEFIEGTVDDLRVDCGLQKVPGYLAAAKGKELKLEGSLLNQEAIIARSMGFDVHYLDSDPVTPLPRDSFRKPDGVSPSTLHRCRGRRGSQGL